MTMAQYAYLRLQDTGMGVSTNNARCNLTSLSNRIVNKLCFKSEILFVYQIGYKCVKKSDVLGD